MRVTCVVIACVAILEAVATLFFGYTPSPQHVAVSALLALSIGMFSVAGMWPQ